MASVKLIKFLDKYLGSFICIILSLMNFKDNKNTYTPKKILLVQLWGLGESVLTLPTINILRHKFNKSEIEILVTSRNKEVYYKNKDLSNIIAINLNPLSIKYYILKNFRKYDLVIDMEEYLNISSIITFFTGKRRIGYSHGFRSGLYTDKIPYNDKQHVVQTFLDLLSPLYIKKKASKLIKLNYSPNDKKKVDKLLKDYKLNKSSSLVGFGVGAAESAKSRMWPIDRFAKVADYLIKKYNLKILIFGVGGEYSITSDLKNLTKNKKSVFNLAGKINTREMFYLISKCKFFIGNDSGPMHVAAAMQVPTIGLFGCNLPLRFGPFGKKNISLYKKSTQDACINVHKGQVDECKQGIGNACVRKIQVNDVKTSVDKLLKK